MTKKSKKTNNSDNTSKATSETTNKANLDELREKLRTKIASTQMARSSKIVREKTLEDTLSQVGIDKTKFKEDLKSINKQGGFTLNMKD